LRLKPKRSYGVAIERKRGLRAGRILCRQMQDTINVIELLMALMSEGGGRIEEQKRGSETVRTPQTLPPRLGNQLKQLKLKSAPPALSSRRG
jgi:hypothetical protein